MHLKLGEVGVLFEKGEDFDCEIVGLEGIAKVVGRGIVLVK